jgi:hypothetical protein
MHCGIAARSAGAASAADHVEVKGAEFRTAFCTRSRPQPAGAEAAHDRLASESGAGQIEAGA